MKFLKFVLPMLAILVLGACSAVNEAKNTVTYVPSALDYAADVTTFANQAPLLAQQAIVDEDARKDLEDELNEMKSDINDFNALTPPSAIEDLHQQVVGVNEKLLTAIDTVLPYVEKGALTKEIVEQFTPITEEVKQITQIIEEIKQIGQ